MMGTLGREWSQKIERYEAKYTIPYEMVEPISAFVSFYCQLDEYSQKAPDHYYRVNNLYFDSPNYLFLKKRLDISENRFNLRIRSYGDEPQQPYFLEVKQKKVNVVRKFRSALEAEGWQELFELPFETKKEITTGTSNLNLFLTLTHIYNAAPKVLTQYRRMAYVSEIDVYARVTFDIGLRYQPEDEYNVIPDDSRMTPLDNITLFDPACNTILELKCNTTQVPLWMVDLVRRFNLRRKNFSKYVTGVTEVLNLYHYTTGSHTPSVRNGDKDWYH